MHRVCVWLQAMMAASWRTEGSASGMRECGSGQTGWVMRRQAVKNGNCARLREISSLEPFSRAVGRLHTQQGRQQGCVSRLEP